MQLPKKVLNACFRAIRLQFLLDPRYKECVAKASKKKGPRGGLRTKCSDCKKWFIPGKIEVDHIEPVVPYSKFYYELTVEEYYERVWNLPITPLCKPCHKVKTKADTVKRKEAKK